MKRFALFILSVMLTGCANITTPSGGPKDIAPPELTSSTPNDKEKNFKGKTIELTFDEAVKLNNAKEEIIISPSAGKLIEYKVKGSKVSITPEDGWKDSTTYSLLFRDGIQDITENNSPINLKLAFSTGPQIDSLSISGKVTHVLTGNPLEKITVAIYKEDTFNIFSHTPSYFTKTNKKGIFRLENIKEGNYRIYAFDDKNKNLKAESRTEQYGFLSDYLTLQNSIDSLDIGLFMLDSRKLKLSSIRYTGSITKVRFNKFITEYQIESQPELTSAFGDNQTELNIWCPDELTDSLQLRITAKDSLNAQIDSIFYIKKTNKSIKDTFKWSLGNPRVESETGKFLTKLTFNKPISKIDFDSLFIELDTINKVFFTKKDITIDEHNKEITIAKEIDKNIFKAKIEPKLNLKAGNVFVTTIDGDSSKTLKVNVSIYWPESTGILSVQTETSEKYYILQLMDGQGKVITSVYNQNKFVFKNLAPQQYQIRIILDTNNNQKWDPGNFEKNLEPEKVIFYKTSTGKTTFPIRANWELGPLIVRF